MSRWAYFANSSGRYPPALSARSASAACRVDTSTSAGRWAKKLRITVTCPSPISPARWPAAVALNCGANGSPVKALRSPRSWASAMRRPASALVMRNRSASPERSEPPSSLALACASSWLINACCGVRSLRATRSIHSKARSRSGVVSTSKDNSHRRSASSPSASMTSTISSRLLAPMPQTLGTPTDKKPRVVTVEAKVTQGITIIRRRRRRESCVRCRRIERDTVVAVRIGQSPTTHHVHEHQDRHYRGVDTPH